MHYAPNEFRDGGQVDPRRWNENVQALRDRENELLGRRWVRFPLQLPFTYFDKTEHDTIGQLFEYRWELPYDYEIEEIYLSVNSSDSETYELLVNGDTVQVAGDGAGGFVSRGKSVSQQVYANTEITATLNINGSPGAYDADGAYAIVYCKCDAMRDIDGTLAALTAIELDTDDDLTHTYANTLFANHAANMAKFSADGDAANSVQATTSQLIVLEPNGAAIGAAEDYHILRPGMSGFYVDQIDFYVEHAHLTTTTFRVQDDGVDLASHSLLNVIGIAIGSHTFSGLGIVDTDGEIAVKFESSGTVYRVWAVVHYVARS